MENNEICYHKIKISGAAYDFLKAKAREEEKYRGRGLIGVVDDITVGRFTTAGSGGNHHTPKITKNSVDKR